MAFTAAGLGGSFARGILEGSEGARQRREDLQAKRESDYVGMYSQLLKSGDWEPVDTLKGVKDGGVLRVGNVGFLKQKVRQPSELDLLKKLNLESQIGSRGKVAVGSVREISTLGPDGKPAKVPMQWDGEKWSPMGPVVGEVKTPPALTTWVDPRNPAETVNLPTGESPPKGYVKHGGFFPGQNLALRQTSVATETVDDEIRQTEKEIGRTAGMADVAKTQPGVVGEPGNLLGQKALTNIEANAKRVGLLEQKRLMNQGVPEAVAKRAGDVARSRELKKLMLELPQVPEQTKGIIESLYNSSCFCGLYHDHKTTWTGHHTCWKTDLHSTRTCSIRS
jgi:hypothetical protein